MAYLGSSDASIIQKIRARLEVEANRFCREKVSLNRFHDELVDFDATTVQTASIPSYIKTPFPQRQDQPRERSGRYENPNRSNESGQQGQRAPLRRQPKETSNGRQDATVRKFSVKKRLNPVLQEVAQNM